MSRNAIERNVTGRPAAARPAPSGRTIPMASAFHILVIGNGGREHALAWRLARSASCRAVSWAGGPNAGLARIARRLPVDVADHDAVAAACRAEGIDLVVVGPEAPLVAGLADDLRAEGIATFGPSRAAARLEASKGFTKDFCTRHGIPTAAYARFDDEAAALSHLAATGAPVVVKADGLAAGKGVVVAETVEEAEAAVRACFAGSFGAAGASVVLEERLVGREASLFALSDGRTAIPFGTAEDHKRAFDGDAGPNTGGMGAFSPSVVLAPALHERAMAEIVAPTVAGMAAEGTPFAGVLYAGLMVTAEGPKLIEFNVRFGDPECQALMVRLEDDLAAILYGAATGALPDRAVRWSDAASLTVVMATRGYPGAYRKGSVIGGLAAAEATGAVAFHAGTDERDGETVAVGGRVLGVTATGAGVPAARAAAYRAVGAVDWPEGFFRTDIGARAG